MNAVIYARYSSYNQTERSIEGQLEDCTEYANRNGLTIVGTYCDRAKSGTKAETRPEFLKMIKDSEKQKFQAVLVWKLDRFARNRYDSAMFRAKLKKNGVGLKSVTENISDEPDGIILQGVIEAMAEYYSANLSQNVKRGLRVARERGTFTGGRVMLGYQIIDKKPVPHPQEAELVRSIFERIADGQTVRQIIDDLNARGLRTRAGQPFTRTSFQTLLKSPRVAGYEIIDGERSPSIYPAIVSEELFSAVQARLAVNAHLGGREKAKDRYLLQGKAFCGHCGAPMVGESGVGRRGTLYRYYTCATRKATHACKKKNVPKHELENLVVNSIVEKILSSDRIKSICAAVSDYFADNDAVAKIKELEAQLREVEDSIRKTADLMLANADLPALIKPLREKAVALSARAEDIKADLSATRAEAGSEITPESVHEWVCSFAKKDFTVPEHRISLIETFLNSVYVFDDHLLIFCNSSKDTEQIPYADALKIPFSSPAESTAAPPGGSDSGCQPQPFPQIRTAFIYIGCFGLLIPLHQDG